MAVHCAVLGNLHWGLNQVLHPDLCSDKVSLEVKSSHSRYNMYYIFTNFYAIQPPLSQLMIIMKALVRAAVQLFSLLFMSCLLVLTERRNFIKHLFSLKVCISALAGLFLLPIDVCIILRGGNQSCRTFISLYHSSSKQYVVLFVCLLLY